MNDLKDYLINHYEGCDYCQEIEAREDLTSEKKYDLQYNHAMSVAADRADLNREE